MGMSFVQIKNVHKKYGKIHAVKGVSFDCTKNEFLVILGPSGAGKTSTLKMIAGLEPISEGEIFVAGQLINHIPPENREVAMVFESYALYPHLTVFENISFPLQSKLCKISKDEIKKRVHETAKLLQIENLLDRSPAKMSGGQKQRVSLGRALVRNTKLLLMDEPLSHLDAKLRHNMRRELKKVHSTLHTTVIYVTHDYLEALALANRIVVLIEGRIHQIGTPYEVYHNPTDVQVASLLGQPKINLIPSVIEKRKDSELFLVSDDMTIQIPFHSLKNYQNNEFLVGIRPQYIKLSNNMDVKGIDGEVYVSENLGIRNLVEVKIGKHIVRVLSNRNNYKIGQRIKIQIPSDKITLFDIHSGKNLFDYGKS
jgi:multiple sugar transport system ATP-binding protein